jgi:hypothetical protein
MEETKHPSLPCVKAAAVNDIGDICFIIFLLFISVSGCKGTKKKANPSRISRFFYQ